MTIRRIALLAAAALVIGTAAAASASLGASGKLTPEQVAAVGRAWSVKKHEPNPRLIRHVESTREQAVLEASGGDRIASSQDVYLIEIHGHFVDDLAPRPLGTPAPTGSVLTVVIDASTGTATDWGVSDRVPNLAALGPVTTDR